MVPINSLSNKIPKPIIAITAHNEVTSCTANPTSYECKESKIMIKVTKQMSDNGIYPSRTIQCEG